MFQSDGYHEYTLANKHYAKKVFSSRGQRTELFVEESVAESTLIRAVTTASRFIMIIGGRGGTKEYIDELTKRVQSGNLAYWRLITGSHIPHFLCEHLRSVYELDNVRLAHDQREHYGVTFVNEMEVILTSANPEGGLFAATRIPGANLAQKYREFIMELFVGKELIKQDGDIMKLCRECSNIPNGNKKT